MDVISKASEFVFKQVCSCFCVEVNHICRLDKNLEALEKAMGILKARRNDVLNWVKRDEDRGLQRLDGVQVWLLAVETIENQVDKIEMHMACTAELQGLSLCNVCSKKLASRFLYGKEVFSMLEDVKELTDRKITGDFNAVSAPHTRDVVEEKDLHGIIVGQETVLEKAWNHLMDDGTQMMGLYGIGGVGKTTLLEQINNKFQVANDDGFEKVIWVVVSRNLGIEKIQDEIAEKLGFGGEGWKKKEKTQKASEIQTRLKNKKFVLLLDDIWEEVDLKEIGVPFPTRENGCKVAFTTRSRQACGQMGVDDPIEVKCLEPDEAWDLFHEKVGRNTLESHPDILERACQVARKCRGLPLALILIGKNMACKRTVQEWDEAIDTLASSAVEFPGMEDHIFPILLYSYDSLKGDHVKSCFQYCALFPEDCVIEKEKLVDYWICEGFIAEKKGLRKAKNKAHGIIGTLVQACLLIEEGESKSRVKMHDVVREMALWIANDFGKDEERCIVKADIGLREVPKVENWTSVRRMSLMCNEIKKISDTPKSPELTTLLFQYNRMRYISGEYFKYMPRLVVLDLSENMYSTLEISELVSLRYLDLSNTHIKRLQGGLLKLKKLIYLNLESTELESISGISNLSSLRTLRLAHSNMSEDLNVMKELELLEHLEVVTVDIGSWLVADQLLNATATRVANAIQEIQIKFIQGKDVLNIPSMAVLRTLDMYHCEMVEIKVERRTSSLNKMPTTSAFPNLSRVSLRSCNGLKDVTWLLYAPNLAYLTVDNSSQIEDIISKEKAENIFTEAGTLIPFQRLERFDVDHLPELKSIYWSPLPFPCLRDFHIKECPNLRRLPLDSKSGCSNAGEDLVIHNREQNWIDEVEWEDEATKERFLRSLQQY